ncbi:CaiB/BaiF CoA transferase family protein [Rhodococcus opacus]|uniref:Fatty acid-CoA racemase n=1 Tax=Rhodococcus opacus (strain B4) TaxID=632772 RepID=C1BB62_RHOOB|nr:fatty acid-CoA racemase [Rhodococcus opacus B4]
MTDTHHGPLAGIRVLELAGLGPAPHAALMLADLGADVVRVQRPDPSSAQAPDPTLRGRRIVTANLKDPDDLDDVRALALKADILIEGFRPGVAERLGLGPDTFANVNPGLIYGRMTGWGQDGPWAAKPGHDINFIAATGVLNAIGPAEGAPLPPLNLIGDFGGGSMFLIAGLLAALVERTRSGRGQVVDAAMLDGTLTLAHSVWAMRAAGDWTDERGANVLDGGAPYYDCYRTADGGYMAVGAIEPQFYQALLDGLAIEEAPDRDDRSRWPELRELFATTFATRSRAEWETVFDSIDACVTPVLSFDEVSGQPQVAHRQAIGPRDGVLQPGAAPRLSRTPNRAGQAAVVLTDINSIW